MCVCVFRFVILRLFSRGRRTEVKVGRFGIYAVGTGVCLAGCVDWSKGCMYCLCCSDTGGRIIATLDVF